MSEERTIGQLVAETVEHVRDLVRHEIALAKAELKDDAKQAGLAGGMLAGAGLFGLLAVIMGLHSAAWGIVAAGLPEWAGYLIVFGALLVVAAVLGLLGKSRLGRVQPPQRTIATSKDTVAAIKGDRTAGTPVGPSHRS